MTKRARKKRERPRLWTFVALTPRRLIVERMRCTESQAEEAADGLVHQWRLGPDWHLVPGHVRLEIDA